VIVIKLADTLPPTSFGNRLKVSVKGPANVSVNPRLTEKFPGIAALGMSVTSMTADKAVVDAAVMTAAIASFFNFMSAPIIRFLLPSG
jgi:hypothetical protein